MAEEDQEVHSSAPPSSFKSVKLLQRQRRGEFRLLSLFTRPTHGVPPAKEVLGMSFSSFVTETYFCDKGCLPVGAKQSEILGPLEHLEGTQPQLAWLRGLSAHL